MIFDRYPSTNIFNLRLIGFGAATGADPCAIWTAGGTGVGAGAGPAMNSSTSSFVIVPPLPVGVTRLKSTLLFFAILRTAGDAFTLFPAL